MAVAVVATTAEKSNLTMAAYNRMNGFEKLSPFFIAD
jgi:hypothetical protein